jgi:hypothetical protein
MENLTTKDMMLAWDCLGPNPQGVIRLQEKIVRLKILRIDGFAAIPS